MAIKRRGESASATKRRGHIRSCAEAIRLLAEKGTFDAEGRDLTAFLVFNLRGIYQSIDESALAWDDRNYWKKAEGLREKWRWSKKTADHLEDLILKSAWEQVPPVLISIIPHFKDVTIKKLTRDADWWVGACRALRQQNAVK